MRNLIPLLISICVPYLLSATLIFPPNDMGELANTSDYILYGEVLGNIGNNAFRNEFKVLDVIKGADVKTNQIITLAEWGNQYDGYYRVVSGDTDFKIGKKYLVFLTRKDDGTFQSQLLSMGVYEEGNVDGKTILAHEEAYNHLMFGDEEFDSSGFKSAYQKEELIRHLRNIVNQNTFWNTHTAGLFLKDYVSDKEINFNQYDKLEEDSQRAPCPNTAPCQCATLFGTGASQTKYEDNNWTVCVAGGASTDPTTATEITDLQSAISAINCMPGINITYTGIDGACNSGAWGAATSGASAGLACAGGFGNNCNKMFVFFDDPFNEISDVNANCNGVLGIGGHFSGGAPHVDDCGTSWNTACNPYFVMNNFGVCAPNTVSQYSYSAVLAHEMLHALGIGHHYEASGFTTTPAGNNPCGTGAITHDQNECSGIMNPVVCNANEATNAPKFGITAFDDACTEWMYNIAATTAECTALAGEPITTPEQLCDADAGAFDLSDKFDPASGSFDDGAGNIDPVNTNYVAVDQATGEILGVATSTAIIDLSGAPVGTVACVYQLAYTQALLDDVTLFLDNLLCNTLCVTVPFVGTTCLGDVGYCPGVSPVELAPFLDLLNQFFGFNETQICNFLDNQILTITDPTGLIGDQMIDLAANGLDFCADKSDVPYCVEIISCENCMISNVSVNTDGECSGDDATYEICFDVEGGSGAYDLVDTNNANSVLGSISGSATDTDPAIAGDELCIMVTVSGPTAASSLDVDVVDNADGTCIGGIPIVVTIPLCPLPDACTAIAGEALPDAPIVLCNDAANPVDANTIFGPASGGFDSDGDGVVDAMVNTNYIAVDANGDIVAVTAAGATTLDLSALADGETACIYQLAYTQGTLDAVTSFLDNLLCNTLCVDVPFVGTTCLGDVGYCPGVTQVELAPFLDLLNQFFGFNETQICDFIDNQVLTITDPTGVIGDQMIDLVALGIDFCVDKSEVYCVTVEATACPAACEITDIVAGDPVCSADGTSYTVTLTVTGTDTSVSFMDVNSVEGTQASAATVTFTYPAGTGYVIVITDTDGECFFTDIQGAAPDCGGASSCTAMAGEALADAPTILCNDAANPVDANTIFGSASGGFDSDGDGVVDAMVNTNYIAVDANGDIVAVTAAGATTLDLSSLADGETACIYQLAYTQGTLDAVTGFLDNLLCNTLCVDIPFVGTTCLGDVGYCPGVTPAELAPFLDLLNQFFGFNETQICDFIDNQVLTIPDPTGVIGDQTIDLVALGIDFCVDKSEVYCVTVSSAACAPPVECEAMAPVISNDGGDCPDDANGSGDGTPYLFSETGGNMNAPLITEYMVLDGPTGFIIGVFPTLATAQAAASAEAIANGDACIQAINHVPSEFDALIAALDTEIANLGLPGGLCIVLGAGCPSFGTLENFFNAAGGLLPPGVLDVVLLQQLISGDLSALGFGVLPVPDFCHNIGNESCIVLDSCIACDASHGTLNIKGVSPRLEVTCSSDPVLSTCEASDIESAYNAWAAGFTASGGCGNLADNIAGLPTLADALALSCNGTISFRYVAQSFSSNGDLCAETACDATFTVLAL